MLDDYDTKEFDNDEEETVTVGETVNEDVIEKEENTEDEDTTQEDEQNEDVVEEERQDTVDQENGVENEAEEEVAIVPDVFYVRSSQGVSINSVNFCRGKYRLGQLVSTMIINEDIRDNILSLDAQSIVTNPHLAM